MLNSVQYWMLEKSNDFKNHNGYLEALPLDDLPKDMRASLEYTPVPYQGGKDYNGGCSLDLYSITALKMEGQILHYETSSLVVPVKEPDFTSHSSHSTYTL